MKLKLILTTAIVGVVLAVPSASSAQLPPLTQDFAIGSGSTAIFSLGFSFEVVSGPSGENPTGFATVGQSTYTDFICFSVTGNTATSVIRISPDPDAFAQFAYSVVVDNSPAAPDTFLATEGIGSPFTSPPSCSTPLPVNGLPLTSGDIIVHDAPPLPTTHDQCKDGGWPQFGFANQGQCVAFVERGPGPQEASGAG